MEPSSGKMTAKVTFDQDDVGKTSDQPLVDPNPSMTEKFNPNDPPAVLIPFKSPAGVYVQNSVFIEKNLCVDNEKMKSRFRTCSDLYKSYTARLLLNTAGVRLTEAHRTQSKGWRELVTKILSKRTAESAAPESEAAKETNKLQEVPLYELPCQRAIRNYVGVGPRPLFSMIEFISGAEDWVTPGNSKSKLSGKFASVSSSLGIDKTVIEASPNGSDVFSFGRLIRCFRGTFLVSKDARRDHFDRILIKSDSAFMENVILSKGVGKKGSIPILGVHVYSNSSQSDFCAECSEKNAITCSHKIPAFNEDSIIYLEMSLDFVLNSLQETSQELHSIYTESGDDLI